ncbi:MAG TPA: lysylphosphatidylglycerol synthase domain-containing protein [Puia sp.]
MAFNKNIKLIINYVAGPLIMLFLFYAVARQLAKQPHWQESLHQMLQAALGQQRWKLYSMIGLMGVNWALESYKWQIALKPVQPIRFLRAFKAVLAGTCIASFTPNRVGEYLGRMLFVDQGNKILSIAPTILCSMSQMLVTLAAGTLGVYLFSSLPYHFDASWTTPSFFKAAGVVVAAGAIGLGLVYFRFDPLVKRVNQWIRKNERTFSIPDNFRFTTLTRILLISVIRYSVFLLQYYLLFSLFGIPLFPQQVFTGVSVMFVLMAIVPTLTFLTDLGFRWLAGIQIFQVYTMNTAGILAVSLGVWLINLIIPALVGSLLILRIKLFQNK